MKCAKCGSENAANSRFCAFCGAPVAQEGASAPTAPGERRQVTVMFCDISGYTAMTERVDPEDVNEFLSLVKRIAGRITAKHGGTINQFVGDEVMIVFGIPTAQEDDPIRAVKAALDLHVTFNQDTEEFRSRTGERIALHSGLSTGLVFAQYRDDREGLYQLTGDAVNTAARLRSLAGANEVLIGPATQRFVRPFFETVPRPPVFVKGKAAPLIPYHVICESRIRTRFEAARERGFRQYVGRDRELEMLKTCFAKALEGSGQLVTVEGEPGIGKSRLLYEFLAGIDRELVTTPQGRCQSYGTDTPYFPFLDALRRGLYLTEYPNQAEALEAAVTNIRRIDPDLERFLPFLLHLLSIPSKHALPAGLSGEPLRRTLEEALVAVITAVTRIQPMVLILEDWHWSDAASQSAFRRLAPLITRHRLLVVVSYRSGFGLDAADIASRNAIRLDPLKEAEADDLVRSVTGASRQPGGLAALIWQSADGNPLFIEEACYSLIESGAISISDGNVRLHQPLDQLLLPDTVQAVIRARLDRLDEAARAVLGISSVIGRTFGERVLERVVSDRTHLTDALASLQGQEIVRRTRLLPEPEYVFKHVLTREVAYEALSHQRRRHLHELVATAVEDLYPERLQENAPILAHHFARSARVDKAVHYALKAGERAAQLYANAEAATYYDDALMLATTLPKSAEAARLRFDAILGRIAAGGAGHHAANDRELLQQAYSMASELEDRIRMTQALYWLGRNHYVAAELHRAIEYAQRSLELADELGDPQFSAGPVNLMGRAYWQLSDFAKSARMMERSVQQMAQIGNQSEESTAAGFVSALFGYMGQFDKALEYSDRAIRLSRALKNPFAESAGLHYRGIIRDQQGQWDSAIADYATAQSIAGAAGDTLRLYIARFMEGRACHMRGDRLRARKLLQESLSLAGSSGISFLLGQAKSFLAACCLADGDLEEAREFCTDAIKLTEKAGDKFSEALALRALSQVLGSSPRETDRAEAQRAIHEAIHIQDAIQAKPELGRSYLILATLLGRNAGAAQALDEARGLFAELGMTWDLAQADAARAATV
jgi:class 3 adenylate cyclase/tetratricopeptide (TPR) repeat protein